MCTSADSGHFPHRRLHSRVQFLALLIIAIIGTCAYRTATATELHRFSDNEVKLFDLMYKARFDELRSEANAVIQRGDGVGNFFLSWLYYDGLGVAKDRTTAVKLLRTGVTAHDPLCEARLGALFVIGLPENGLTKDPTYGIKLIRDALNTGHPHSAYYLGLATLTGDGVAKNADEGIRLLQQARSVGDSAATASLARYYRWGPAISRDPDKAVSFYREAAEAGNPYGLFGHAESYLRENKPRKAYDLLKIPVELKIPEAQAMLGHILLYGGHRVHADRPRAIALLTAAEEQGNTFATYLLGQAHERGVGFPKSRYIAADYYYKAGMAYAKSGDRDAAIQRLEDLERVGGDPDRRADLRRHIPGGAVASTGIPSGPAEHSSASGTGWVTPGGLIVTANHVVEGASKVQILLTNGKRFAMHVVVADPANDIAVLAADKPGLLPPGIPIADHPAGIGAHVFTIGYPQTEIMGESQKLTDGIVSATSGIRDDPRFYQVTVPVQAGNSGGPLLDMNGRAIGIVISKLNAVRVFQVSGDWTEGVNYGIKSDYLKILINGAKQSRSPSSLGSASGDLEVLSRRIMPSVVRVIAESN